MRRGTAGFPMHLAATCRNGSASCRRYPRAFSAESDTTPRACQASPTYFRTRLIPVRCALPRAGLGPRGHCGLLRVRQAPVGKKQSPPKSSDRWPLHRPSAAHCSLRAAVGSPMLAATQVVLRHPMPAQHPQAPHSGHLNSPPQELPSPGAQAGFLRQSKQQSLPAMLLPPEFRAAISSTEAQLGLL